jgi:dihydroxyacetone kinase DhaKLM complex PTS-EIIA-like component DhaM
MAISKLVVVNRSMEVHEELRKLITQVQAQIALISGDGLENFCNHNDQIKSDYLWSMSDTAARAIALIDRVTDA